MALGDREIPRRQVRQGGGRGTGEDHVDGMYGCTELFVYLTPNTRPKGYESLKSYLESQDCEVVAGAEAPAELEAARGHPYHPRRQGPHSHRSRKAGP